MSAENENTVVVEEKHTVAQAQDGNGESVVGTENLASATTELAADNNDAQSKPEPEEEKTKVEVPPPPIVRRDFYQTESDFVLSILAKNVDPASVSVDFTAETLSLKAKLADGQDYVLTSNLFGRIRPEASSFKVTRTKIEVSLRKDSAGTWTALEAAAKVEKKDAVPTYPSSSKFKKDWTKVEKDIEAEVKDDEDINNLFSKIYNSGDEDMKKAMMKSMQESGGTVLSTNWSEVGKKQVDISPPDGMEWKKWE